MKMSIFKVMFCCLAAGLLCFSDTYSLDLSLDKPDGIYHDNDMVQVSMDFRVNGKAGSAPIEVKIFQVDGSSETINLPAGKNEFSAPLRSGALRFVVSALGSDGKVLESEVKGKKVPVTSSIGVIADPDKCAPYFKEPEDFQQFWDNAMAELAKVPVKAERKETDATSQQKGKFNFWDVKVDCAGGMPVSGYLSMPVNAVPKSLPVVVIFQSAGVGNSWKSVVPGAICFSINAHGIENGRPPAFYQELQRTTYKNYWWIGAEDRNKFYFRGMFLRVKRALDYVKTLPEYDGSNLIVFGGSQGGAQALAAAALDSDVKVACAMVPGMCDLGGIVGGRLSGWPRLIRMKDCKLLNKAVANTLQYYEMAFFAKRVKAEVFFTVGLVDNTCCPTSVYAAYNSIPGKKHIEVFPKGGHLYSLQPKAYVELLQKIVGHAKAE